VLHKALRIVLLIKHSKAAGVAAQELTIMGALMDSALDAGMSRYASREVA
jgi:hypothetical protein